MAGVKNRSFVPLVVAALAIIPQLAVVPRQADDRAKAALAAQAAVGGTPLGVVADLTWGIPRADIDRTVAGMRAAGIEWVRANQNWAGGEPDSKGVLNNGWLAEIDYAVNKATAAGIHRPVGAVLADGQGVATIVNDDGLRPGAVPGPAVSISDATVVEGPAGTASNATFTISLSAPAPLLISVGAATADGSAAGPDLHRPSLPDRRDVRPRRDDQDADRSRRR